MDYFTSNSEFDLVKRVQVTNETPIYDLFQGTLSILRNDFWKWYLGTQEVDWDMPYGKYDPEYESTYFKMVNGELSDNYGPSKNSFNPSPTYHKMKLTGVLAPEYDLFVHEIYRYLKDLYPDHYDYTEILTKNEINSMISNAASLVDYNPNLKFFDLLSESFDLDSQESTDKESLKLKIRDLKANAFRRKFYGSKLGYKMFGSSVFENISIFPLGTYLPIVPEDLENGVKKTVGAQAHKINVRSNLYKNRFKLIDWDGSSRKISTEEDSNIYGKYFNLPGFDYQMFMLAENYEDYSDFNNISTNDYFSSNYFEENDTIYVSGKTSSLVKSSDIITADRITQYENSTTTLDYLTLSKRAPIFYIKAFSLGNWSEYWESFSIEEIATMRATLGDGFDTFIAGTNTRSLSLSSSNSNEFLYRMFNRLNDDEFNTSKSKFKDFKCISSPYNTGLLFTEPSNVLDIYKDSYSASAIISKNGVLEGYETPVASVNANTSVEVGDLICTTNFAGRFDDSLSLVKVSKINLGEIKFTSNPVTSYVSDSLLGYSCPVPSTTSLYGVVISSKDGETKVFVQGELDLTLKTQALYTVPANGTFHITAIPELLTDELLSLIYPVEYSNLIKERKIQEDLLLIDSRREAAQIAINEINNEIAFLKINKAKLTENKIFIDRNGNEINYETYSIFNGCFIEKFFKIIGDFDEMVNNEGTYFWHEMVTYYGALIDYIDYGTYSVLPILSAGSISTNTEGGYFTEIKEESITGQRFQYLDLIEGYLEKSSEYKMTEKAPGYLNDTMKKQFSYNFISGNNTTISEIVSYDVEIEGVVVESDEEKLTINFESEAALHDMQCLGIGDKVFGAGCQEDTYITDVGDNYVSVNKKLMKTGEVLFTFTTSFSCAGKDLTEEFDFFRKDLKENNLLKLINPFENGLWPSSAWPTVSNAFVDGLVDVSFFNVYEPTFYRVMKGTHSLELKYDSNNSPTNYVIPSTIKFNNDLFAEINLNRIINIENRAGVTGNLCNVEFIDYVSNAVSDLARGTDKVNCGTQLSMQTDISGYFTQVSGQSYTDPSIKLRFQTFNSNDGFKIPCYAQIGSKGNGRFNWFKSADDNVAPMIFGASFFDQQRDGLDTEYTDLINNKGTYAKRSLWASRSDSETEAEDNSLNELRYVEKPLFEIALGEYDVQYDYTDPSDSSNKIHTIQCNFYRQKFDNIKFTIDSNDDEAIKLISNKFENLNVVSEINKNSIVVDSGNSTYVLGISESTKSYLNDIVYCGVWIPETENDEIKYPIIDPSYESNLSTTLYYMVVETGKTLKYRGNTKTLTVEDNSMLILTKNSSGTVYWKLTTFALGGSNYPTAILSDTVQEKDSFNVMCQNIAGNYFVDSSARVIINSVDTFKDNFNTYSQDITNSFDDARCYIYVCLFDGEDKNGGTAYDTTASTVFSAGSYVAVIYDRSFDTIRFFKLNTNTRFISSLKLDKPSKMSTTEFKMLTGATTIYSDTNLRSKVTKSIASINLPKPFLTDGSVNINVIVDGGFISKGYKLSSDGKSVDTSSFVYFNISSSAIYYDDDLSYFYVNSYEHKLKNGSYVQVSDTIEKFYIYFSDPIYFKNTLRNYGTYKLEKTQTSGSSNIDYSPVVNQIEGFTSLYDKLSNEDDILEVREIVARSFYNALYNSVGFDSHSSLSADITSVNEDFTQFNIIPTSTSASEKIELQTKINNLWPIKIVNNETELDFEKNGDQNVLLRNFGTNDDYRSPKLLEVIGNVSSKDISSQETTGQASSIPNVIETKFFKNNLISLAAVNPENPNKLIAYGNEAIFGKVLSVLKPNDSVEAIVALSSDTDHSRTITISLENGSFAPNGPYTLPSYVAFNGETFIAVSNDGYVYYKNDIDNLASLQSTISLSVSPVKVGAGNTISPATYGQTNSKIISVDWDDDYKKWIFTFDLKNSDDTMTQFYESTTLDYFNFAFSESEVTSLPSDFDLSNYTNGQKIIASTNETKPSNIDESNWIAHPINPLDAYEGSVAKRSFYAINKTTGDKVLIRGKYIFFKTFTKTIDESISSSKNWKMSTIPSNVNNTKIWLKQYGDNDARYLRVSSALTDMKEILTTRYNDIMASADASAKVKSAITSAYNFINSFVLFDYSSFSAEIMARPVTIISIYKVKVPNTTTDPNFALLTGKTLVSFSGTIVTTDSYITTSTFSYDSASYIPVGSVDNTPDIQSAYLDYLADVSSYILNDSFTQKIISGSIDKVELTDSHLIIKTTFDTFTYFPISASFSVEDIQNTDNWVTPSSLGSDAMHRNSDQLEVFCVIGSDGTAVALGSEEKDEEKKIYEICSITSNSSVKVLGGYWKKKSQIESFEGSQGVGGDSETTTRKKYIPAYNSGSADINYPCILFSKEEGSFESALIGSDISNSEYSLGTSFAGLKINKIIYEAGEFKAFLSYINGSPYDYYLTASSDDLSKWNWFKPATQSYISQFNNNGIITFNDNSEIVSSVVFNPNSIDSQGNSINSGNNSFSLSSPFALMGENIKVKSISDISITLDQNLVNQANGKNNISVLIAFKTKEAIQNQMDYLDFNLVGECLSSKKNLKVPAVSEVSSYYDADKVYQFRELLTTSEITEKVLVGSVDSDGNTIQTVTERTYGAQIDNTSYSYGYPSIFEDSEREFYDYTSYLDEDGNVAYLVKDLVNSSGNKIMLCNSFGETLINRETNDFDDKCLTIYDEFMSSLESTKSALYAGQYKYATIKEALKYGAKIKNKEFTASINGVSLKITSMNNDISNPFILVKANTSILNCIKNILYTYNEEGIESYVKDLGLHDIVNNTYDVSGNIISTETISVSSQYENRNGYIYDVVNNRFNLSKNINISAILTVPYIFYGDDLKVTYNPSVKADDSGILKLNESMTGIYMPLKGYGGFSTNEDSTYSKLPWAIDSDAFLNKELYNVYGEPVYLVDSEGNKIYHNEGTLFIEPNIDYVSITSEDMDYSVREIRATQKIGNASVTTTSNVYEPEDSSYVLILTNEMAPVNRDKTSGIIYNNETTMGKAVLYKGIEEITNDVSYSIDYGTYTTINVSINANGEYVVNYWNDNQSSINERAIITVKASISGKVVASAKLTYLEFITSQTGPVIDLFPSSTSDENNNDLLLRGIRYNSDGSLYDNIIEIKIPEVNSYSFTNFTQLADPVSSTEGTQTFLTFKLMAPMTYTGEDCVVSLEDGTLEDKITFRQLIDSSYSIYATNENFDIVGEEDTSSIIFRVFKGKQSVSNNVTSISVVDNNGVSANVSFISNDYYKATFNNSDFIIIPEIITLTVLVNGKTLTKEFDVRHLSLGAPVFNFVGNNNVISNGSIVKFTISSTSENEISIKGIESPVICKVPKYVNFKSLLQNEGQVIKSLSIARKPVNFPIILSGGSNSFILSDKILTDYDEFNDRINDGKAHTLEFNWLTRSTISLEPKNMNNPDLFTKLTLSQIDKYTPDRVYFPDDGYPQPAVTINNVIYNSANNYMYESSYWFNDNQKRIYECDINGNYVVYGLKDNNLSKITFDYKNHFSSTSDLRFNPRKPVYSSCSEWYKSKYYLNGNESNPYWQVIKFADKFNAETRGFNQEVNIYSYQKGTDEMKLITVNDGEKFLNISKAVTAALNNNELSITKRSEYIDHKNGKLQFILQQPDDIYRSSSQFIKFGIWASNPFYGNKIFTDNAAVIKLRSILNLSYIVNSTENVSNPLDKDADIVQVSELGLFDENHNLIAYAIFPEIEYHTKNQHVSFVCYVKDGTCSDIT